MYYNGEMNVRTVFGEVSSTGKPNTVNCVGKKKLTLMVSPFTCIHVYTILQIYVFHVPKKLVFVMGGKYLYIASVSCIEVNYFNIGRECQIS